MSEREREILTFDTFERDQREREREIRTFDLFIVLLALFGKVWNLMNR